MNRIAGNVQQGNTAESQIVDFLALAHQVAEIEQRRLEALATGRVRDFDREILEAAREIHHPEYFAYRSLADQAACSAPRPPAALTRAAADGRPVQVGTILAGLPRPIVTTSRHLRVYSELHAGLVRAGLAGPTMIWDILKGHARKHKGRHAYTSTFIVRYITKLLGWSERRVLRYLRQGEGKLWSCSRGTRDRRERVYHMFSLARVCAGALGARHPGWQTDLPFAAYRGNVAGYKRAVWEVFTAARNRAARSVQARTLGVSESTIYAWQKSSRLEARECSVRAPRPQTQRQLEELTDAMDRAGVSLDPDDPDHAPAWQSRRGHTYWQTTNLYASDAVRLEKGRSGYLRRDADVVMSRANGLPEFSGTDCDHQTPIAQWIEPFEDAERAVRHQERRKHDAVLVLDGKTRAAIPRRPPGRTHAYAVPLQQYRLEYSLASYACE